MIIWQTVECPHSFFFSLGRIIAIGYHNVSCFSGPDQCVLRVAEDCHSLQLNLAVCHCDASVSVTLRNVGEMLEIATAYNAVQLCQACQQFITLNLPALLESR